MLQEAIDLMQEASERADHSTIGRYKWELMLMADKCRSFLTKIRRIRGDA